MDLRIFIEPQQGASYEQQLAVATTTEECGFDAFFRSDHYLKMGGVSGLPGPTDSWVTLGALARETHRIRLGTMVTSATFRFPGPLAISVAQVDAMSGGRIELGIGAGWYEDEHRAYGIPFPPMGERFDRLEEQLEIITGLWETPARHDFRLRGHALLGAELARPAEARPAAPSPDHHRWLRTEADPSAGGALRRRVQRHVPRQRHPVRRGPGSGERGMRGRQSRSGDDGVVDRSGALLRCLT